MSKYNNVSPTAIMCAKSLAKTKSLPFAREIWESLREHDSDLVKEGDGFVYKTLMGVTAKIPHFRKMSTVLEGRHLAVDRELKEVGNPHVLEIASGFSPRGLNITKEDPSRIYIETDLPHAQNVKRDIVEDVLGNEEMPSNYHFMPLNVLDRDSFENAVKPYVNANVTGPLAITHSGLWMYLSPDDQKRGRDNIANILSKYSPDGMWITPDFSMKAEHLEKSLLMRTMIKIVSYKTGTEFSFFDDESAVKEYLREGGFNYTSTPSAFLVPELTSVQQGELTQQEAIEASSIYDIHTMRLNR